MPILSSSSSTDWVSVYTSVTPVISVGARINIQNQSNDDLVLAESATKPNVNSFDGEVITTLSKEEPTKEISSGSMNIWVRNPNVGEPIRLYVQEI